MQGKIIRGIGGFYYVHTHQGVYECRARGIFRKDKEKPLPGDLVSISVLDETEKKGNLDEILPRTNSLIRPAVANVDQALVIFALVSPKPNFNLLDRFLVLMEKQEPSGTDLYEQDGSGFRRNDRGSKETLSQQWISAAVCQRGTKRRR